MYELISSKEVSGTIRHEVTKPLKVLLIDDSQGARQFLAPALKSQGLEIIGEASDGQMGLRFYEEMQPDIVFLDIVMPVISGIEVLKRIKEINPQAIVIMLTSMADRESVLESKRAWGVLLFAQTIQDRTGQAAD